MTAPTQPMRTTALDLAERALGHVRSGDGAMVTVAAERSLLLRFARSHPTQSTSVEDATISGAYLEEVTEGGPAEAAGLQAGDIVTAFDGVPITDATDLTAQVRALAAGSEAEVTYVRDGETRTVEVTLGTLEQ